MFILGYANVSNISARAKTLRSASDEPASNRDTVYWRN
ncbi:MAG: hypothetical protein QOI07_1181 [Verrucomicrobiota bacterium]|jgi:hypothetical protein